MRACSQVIRFALVGMVSNIALYVAYLALTKFGIGHKSSMTFVYFAGVLSTFVLNRSWSFRHEGSVSSALARYIVAYLLFYMINLTGLFIAVDLFGWPHQWVQAAMMVFCAVGLFLTLRFWVFRAHIEAAVAL